MLKNIKSEAATAKQRISSGLWVNPNDETLTNEEKLYLNTRRKSYPYLTPDLIDKDKKDSFFDTVYSLLTSNADDSNIIGRIADAYQPKNVDDGNYQRFVLNVSKAYVVIKQVYDNQKDLLL